MSSQLTTHFPVDAIPRGDGGSGSSEQPLVLIAFAKLIVLAGALLVFTPAWLNLMGALAFGPPPQEWAMFRILALVGSAGVLAAAAMFLKVWTDLLKYLARLD